MQKPSGSYNCWYCGRSYPLPSPDNDRKPEPSHPAVRQVDNCSICGTMTIDEYVSYLKATKT